MQELHGSIWTNLEEATELIIGAPLLWRQVERIGTVQHGEGRALGRPFWTLQYLKGASKKAGEALFIRAEEGLALNWRFKLGVRKILFSVMVVRHYNRLPREAVDPPFLEFSRPGLIRVCLPGLVGGPGQWQWRVAPNWSLRSLPTQIFLWLRF